jgi:hypothetical protein
MAYFFSKFFKCLRTNVTVKKGKSGLPLDRFFGRAEHSLLQLRLYKKNGGV